MKQKSIKIHPNGFTARYHNKRIDFVEKDGGGYIIKFSGIKKNPQAQFTCQSEILKDKLAIDRLPISTESMDLLVTSYLHYKQNKNIEVV